MRWGCLYCSTVPPLLASRRFWNSDQEPGGMRTIRTGPSRRVSWRLAYSRFCRLSSSSTAAASRPSESVPFRSSSSTRSE